MKRKLSDVTKSSIIYLQRFAGAALLALLGAALIFFTWGEIFSLFPSLCSDTFGPKFATSNVALLYTAKGTSAFLVPFANVLQGATGDWATVFIVAASADVLVAGLAVFALRPLRLRVMSNP